MTVNRVAIGDERLVYAICADKKQKYPFGMSPIVYIGTTEKGVARIATSAAYRSYDVLAMHGVKSFDVRIVTCRRRQGIKSWKLLERALLLGFRAQFGDIPKCNSQGKRFQEGREFDVFARERIRQIILDLTEHGQAESHEITA
jgi:hypothetical protein